MSTDSKVVDKVTYRRIFSHTTDESLAELERHIRHGLIIPQEFDQAIIRYNTYESLPEANPDNTKYYPLHFVSRDGSEEVWVSAVTAGYRGTGPHGTIEALKLMGFDLTSYQKEQIFTDKICNLVFNK